MCKQIITFLLLIYSAPDGSAQQVIFGNLYNHLTEQIILMPESSGNQYKNPGEEELNMFDNIVIEIFNENLSEASVLASSLEYNVIRFIDNSEQNNREFILLQKNINGANFWGTYVFNLVGCRNVVIECPHPKFDTNTGLEGAYIFARLNAKALFLSGTHRCNSSIPSTCSGTTSVCGASANYRISDIAHNDRSVFQIVHERISESLPESIFIQLHGFGKRAGDPNLIISNGTRDVPENDLISDLQNKLLDEDPALSFKIIHINTDWTRLTAFTNTQGRYLNNSPEVCSTNAIESSGRFIHIEQELDKFRRDESGWQLMLEGLKNTISCQTVAVNEIEPTKYDHLNSHITFHDLSGEIDLYIYTIEGKLWLREEAVSGKNYNLPPNISIVILMNRRTGDMHFRNKFINIPY